MLVLGILMVVTESDPTPSDMRPFSFEEGSILFLFIWGVWFYATMFVYAVVQGGKALIRKNSD